MAMAADRDPIAAVLPTGREVVSGWAGTGGEEKRAPFTWNALLWSMVCPRRGHRLLPTVSGTLLIAVAFGIAATQAAGLKSNFGTMCKPLHAGTASEHGLRAARLAAIDVDAALQNGQGIEADLRKRGQWDLYERHVVELMPLLARAGRRGNRIDLGYQQLNQRCILRQRPLALQH